MNLVLPPTKVLQNSTQYRPLNKSPAAKELLSNCRIDLLGITELIALGENYKGKQCRKQCRK